ncbi:hypothetical protein B1748_04830 [Paenibacillus sp. MY03]|uniref:WD40/YVTN/BNR-like repeat-containing protein n=1 Tax=Paenibacillus sp. MY03 TaxID=302980 RepID=UPI000B3C76AA|nr:hypothetical protein [Paenibacillus sp. MY03]OUS78092.1 hypothetical protein B1748_04830 [Paenibacillus sp. MY03]
MWKRRIGTTIAMLSLSFMMVTSITAEQWIQMPLVTQLQINGGNTGGEGGQWPQAIAISKSDPDFLIMGTDVGGLYRSLDGGNNWEPTNKGYTPRGNSGLSIDPKNANVVIAVGANSGPGDHHGLYYSGDKGKSWTHVLSANISGYRDFRDQIAFDTSSYDPASGFTKTIYWSRIGTEQQGWGTPTIHSRIYKSTNGGWYWYELENTDNYADGIIKVHPTSGVVYSGNKNGFHRSTNGGTSFSTVLPGSVLAMDVVDSQPNNVWITLADGLYLSTNSGGSFAKITSSNFPAKPYSLKVSPANTQKMVIVSDQGAYNQVRYYTTNGGSSWTASTYNNTGSFLPFNNRQGVFAWHPTNSNTVFSFGGDWITKSTDSGATYIWNNKGNTGVYVRGLLNFNVQNPNLLFVGSQDYNSALTTNGGPSWTYVNLYQQGWGGFVFGAYAATSSVLYGGSPENGKTYLRITRDGGSNVTRTNYEFGGLEVSYGDPTDSNILFAFDHRSTDGGLTWSRMTTAKGVFTHNRSNNHLYGGNNNTVVRSTDKGASWSTLVTLSDTVRDVAADHLNNILYISTLNKLYKYNMTTNVTTDITSNLSVDQKGNRVVKSVAVDPVDPNIIYTAGSADWYMTDASVQRSEDGGSTWEVLTLSDRFSNYWVGMDGGREATSVRVHPTTRIAYFATGCFGLWKMGPPGS